MDTKVVSWKSYAPMSLRYMRSFFHFLYLTSSCAMLPDPVASPVRVLGGLLLAVHDAFTVTFEDLADFIHLDVSKQVLLGVLVRLVLQHVLEV